MRRRISIRGHVRRSVGPSVRPSVRPSRVIFERYKVCILGASCAVYPALFLYGLHILLSTHQMWIPHLMPLRTWSHLIGIKDLDSTVGQINRKPRRKYWATHLSVHSHRSLTSLTPSLIRNWMIGWLFILCFFLFWPLVDSDMGVENPTINSCDAERTPRPCPSAPLHYGTKPSHFETSKIHFPTSEGVSEVSERVSAAEGAREASSPEQVNEWAVWGNEQTDARVAQYLGLYSCLFQTTVRWPVFSCFLLCFVFLFC